MTKRVRCPSTHIDDEFDGYEMQCAAERGHFGLHGVELFRMHQWYDDLVRSDTERPQE